MSTAPLEERKVEDLAHALGLPTGEMDLRVLRDALPKIRVLVNQEIKAQEPKTKRRLAIDERFGTFYGTERVMTELAVRTPQQLSDRIRRHTLLRVKLEDGKVNAYPAFQFKNHEVVPGVKKVLQVLLPVAATNWSVARWMTLSMPQLQGMRPIDVLRGEAETEISADLVFEEALSTRRDWTR
ncbi:hypothetical protein [Arthrobacter sp. S41]|uniref:hypothetical protein n=1 Tax=Arthrobacter sp. S41 TaxID=2509721 RepID=UPI001036227B|nr:hypothetical protein [Arthrobacter sp. S41]TAP25199.1 hypothetical protein EYR88_15170 [Arthrobacter sp. S41]